MKKFHLLCGYLIAAILLASCQQIATPEGNCTITFSAAGTPTRSEYGSSAAGTTRAAVTIGDYFQKLNVMLFDEDGNKYFDKVRTQYSTDENFGQMSLTLPAGEYTVVAVGHSSAKSATIKSPDMVQFTASEGQKLTDTFCFAGTITVGDEPEQHSLTMNRVCAMVRFHFTDEEIPAQLTHVKFDYTGGSANFNPTTSEGTTKSTQSETRPVSANDIYQVYTFPYLSAAGVLKMTISALASDGEVIRKKTIENITVTRNRITTYTGELFGDGEGTITQSGFGFTVNTDWDGVDEYTF